MYAFGVVLLELLTEECPSTVDPRTGFEHGGGALELPGWVQSVVQEE